MVNAFSTEGRLGVNLNSVDDVPQCPVGTIVKGKIKDSDTEGEFIYGRVAAATAEGLCVNLNLTTNFTLTNSATDANKSTPVAFALQTLAINQYGWFQFAGKTKVKTLTDVVAGSKMYLTATNGNVDDAVVANVLINGAVFDGANFTAGFSYATINSPTIQG